MDKQLNKKRSMLIDIALLTSIFGVLGIILFLTLFDHKEVEIEEQKGKVAFSIPQSETSESSSPYQNIKIVTDISNDAYMPFAIQYPLTQFNEVNQKILNSLEQSKQLYIKEMNARSGKLNKKITGELNISFEIFEYEQDKLSFVLQSKKSIPGEETSTSFETYVFDNSNGTPIKIDDVLNTDDQSVVTLMTQILDLTKDDEFFTPITQQSLEKHFELYPIEALPFILTEEHIHIYFNDIFNSQLKEPIHITVPLTSINAILKEQFQRQMVNVEAIVPVEETEKKLVALTFDDGPHPDVTPSILATLEKYNAKATFFMLGSRVQYYPDLAKRVYDLGHEIGNHTWNHPVLTNMTEAQIIKEYTSTEQAIIQATGSPSTIFRPPYGATNKKVKSVIPSPQFNWTVDTLDWKHRNAGKLLVSVKQTVHPNAIILMHDIHLATAEGLEAVMQHLQNEGYQFVTISEILNAQQ